MSPELFDPEAVRAGVTLERAAEGARGDASMP